jgi:phosphoglycerate dehydrogenase-like enzyme
MRVDKSPHILVCGAGSIGQRHIKYLQILGTNVSAWRSRAESTDALASQYKITGVQPAFRSLGVEFDTTQNQHVTSSL